MRALVLDDDRIFLTVAEGLLYTLGIRDTQTTSDAARALELVSGRDINLLLLDLNMPGQDGLAFLRQLSEKGFTGAVVIVSGEKSLLLSSARTLAEKLGLSVAGAMGKPIAMEELRECVTRARAMAETQPASPPKKTNPASTGIGRPLLVYQIQHDVIDDCTHGYEALLRDTDENGNLVSALHVLERYSDNAERFGLTRQLFSQFCRDVRTVARSDFQPRMSFNIDAQILEHDDMVSMLAFMVSRFKVEPGHMVLELTESHLPRNENLLLERIARLSMAGFEFSLDDFSTGASSFEILRAGAFSEVKLDRLLVQRSAEDDASRKYIENMIEVASELDLRLIAEGVETRAEAERMKNMGIRYHQGYFYGRPQRFEDAFSAANPGVASHVA